MNQDVFLAVENVSIRYNNDQLAIEDISFYLAGGVTCALVGVNGSGKSTLFKTIMGLLKPKTGSLSVCGYPVSVALKKNIVSYVPQAEEVDWDFPVSVYDVVMMGRYGYMNKLRIATAHDKEKVQEAMARVDIIHLADRQIGELSGGQKKRVFLARALAQESQIILLDEPFTGVDINTENAIMDLLDQLKAEGCLILISTHNLGTIPEFCDEVLMINRRLLAQGSTQTTFTQENLELAFGGKLRHLQLGVKSGSDQINSSITVLTDDERAAVFYKETPKLTDADQSPSPSTK